MHVQLIEGDFVIIRRTTRARQEDKRAKGIVNKYHGRYSQAQTEGIGLMGEVAFAKLTGLPLDLALRDGGDQGIDFHSSAGTIDVKTTTTGFLIFDVLSDVRADILVAASVRRARPHVHFKGYVRAEEFIRHHVTRDFGYGPRYVMAHTDLAPMHELMGLLKQ